VIGRQSIPGQVHCSNRRQPNSGRKGRHDSLPRVQSHYYYRPPKRDKDQALGGCQCNAGVAGAPSRPRYDISYPISTKSLLKFDIEEKSSISLYPDIAPISCTTSKLLPYRYSRYCNTILYSISNKNFDLEYISSVQRPSKFNIVPDIEAFSSMPKSKPSVSKVAKPLELERPQYRIRYRIRYRCIYMMMSS
jgi:hypothetical protein